MKNAIVVEIGMRFGSLVVIDADRKHYWKCKCDCGKEKVIYRSSLVLGKSKSCGCMAGKKNRTHGLTKTRTFGIWMHMKARCYRKTCSDYPNWGGRGISVCDRWRNSFENFIADMGECPEGMSIDRIDNSGNYEPGNCRWANHFQQKRNTRANVLIEFNGQSKTAGEWSEIVGIHGKTISNRLRCGWSVEDALNVKPGIGICEKLIYFNGERGSLKHHAKVSGIPYGTVFTRISRGWSIERALTK